MDWIKLKRRIYSKNINVTNRCILVRMKILTKSEKNPADNSTHNDTTELIMIKKRDVIILACYSKAYFSPEIREAGANPVLWTTHLMAPEAYTLKSANDGWMIEETGKQIEERAAQTYNEYQKCGIRGARNLFTTGFKNLSE